jgi:hypothetical protein
MSAIIPFSAGTEVPAYLAEHFGDTNIEARFSINQLSSRGKVWRRVVDGEETELTRINKETQETEALPIVSMIVLDHNKGRSRAFYEGGFEEGKNSAPTCSSSDGVVPDARVKEPCAKTCASCPNSVKGSKITENNKQTTACSPFKRIAVVPSQQVGKHPAMLLRLAQTSVWDKDNAVNEAAGWYAWDQYVDMLRQRGAKHTAAVETRIKFDIRTAYPKLLFSAKGWLDAPTAVAAKQLMADQAEDIAKILTGVAENDGVSGSPGIPHEGTVSHAGAAAADEVDEEDVAAAEAAVAAAAEATAKAAKVKAKAEKLAAAQAAAAALLAAAADDDDDEDEGGTATVVAPAVVAPTAAQKAATAKAAKAAAAAKATAASAAPATVAAEPAVEAGTPAALAGLLEGWDVEE